MGRCTCEKESECEHIYAAMRALLAEHSTAAVRNLSAGLSSSIASAAGLVRPRNKPPAADPGDLARRLTAAHQRPLDATETRFVRKVHSSYVRCCQTHNITRWDFQEMGLGLGGYGWDALQIWPAFPADELEFWLYVANTAREYNVDIPQFMEPITDLSVVKDRLARWQRSREVEQWKQKLGNLRLDTTPPSDGSLGETDLRLIIGEHDAALQWRRPRF